jgi:zinc transport system substrate-binding protein
MFSRPTPFRRLGVGRIGVGRIGVGLLGVGLLVAGCSGDPGRPTTGKLQIAASFYPLQYVTQQLAGDRADVSSLTPPGGEPHDLELTAKAVARVHDADLVVYLRGFQPSVDNAVDDEAKTHALDVAPAAALNRTLAEAHEGVGTDPHFWLDPERLEAVSVLIERQLEQADPAGEAQYRANLSSLHARLTSLDAEFRAGLASCVNRDLVTSHQAFGYLAERYHLTQIGITGNSPEQEPNPSTLAHVTDFVRNHSIHTVYYEALGSPAIARTVAAETDSRTAELDPIEALTPQSQGRDYFAVMRSNLHNLQEGQHCP